MRKKCCKYLLRKKNERTKMLCNVCFFYLLFCVWGVCVCVCYVVGVLQVHFGCFYRKTHFFKSSHDSINGWFQLTKYYRNYFLMVLSCQNVIKFNISQIIYKWYRKCILMFRRYCKSIASGTYNTLALKIIFVSTFLYITKSVTKIKLWCF